MNALARSRRTYERRGARKSLWDSTCVSCHDPERAFTDGRLVAVGVFERKGTRNVPTLIIRSYGRSFFWDGRMPSLEIQVLQPIQDPKELDMPIDDVVERLKQDQRYSTRFQAVFGRELNGEDLARAWPATCAPSFRATRPTTAT